MEGTYFILIFTPLQPSLFAASFRTVNPSHVNPRSKAEKLEQDAETCKARMRNPPGEAELMAPACGAKRPRGSWGDERCTRQVRLPGDAWFGP